MVERGTVWRQRETLPKPFGRAGPVFAFECPDPLRLVGLRALQQTFDLDHQRIGRQNVMVGALAQVIGGLGCLAKRGVRQRQRVVRACRFRVASQHVLQVCDRATVVVRREGRAAQPESGGQ